MTSPRAVPVSVGCGTAGEYAGSVRHPYEEEVGRFAFLAERDGGEVAPTCADPADGGPHLHTVAIDRHRLRRFGGRGEDLVDVGLLRIRVDDSNECGIGPGDDGADGSGALDQAESVDELVADGRGVALRRIFGCRTGYSRLPDVVSGDGASIGVGLHDRIVGRWVICAGRDDAEYAAVACEACPAPVGAEVVAADGALRPWGVDRRGILMALVP